MRSSITKLTGCLSVSKLNFSTDRHSVKTGRKITGMVELIIQFKIYSVWKIQRERR